MMNISKVISLVLFMYVFYLNKSTQETDAMSTNQKIKQLQPNQRTNQSSSRARGVSAADSKQQTNRSSTINKMSKNAPQSILRDSVWYRNEPPVFLTATRDFVIDVARAQSGKRVTVVQANDGDGDKLEFQLRPSASSRRDASQYFTINSATGELRLSAKPFKYRLATNSGEEEPGEDDANSNSNENEEESRKAAGEQSNSNSTAELEQNLYFLNVAVNDGHHDSIVEFNIRVTNSTLMKEREADGIPVEDEAEVELRVKQSIMREKTREFYAQLNQEWPHQANSSSNISITPITVYPDYVNPGLSAAESSESPAPQMEIQREQTALSATPMTTTLPLSSSPQTEPITSQPPTGASSSSFASLMPQSMIGAASNVQHQNQNQLQPATTAAEPMMMNLIMIMCSCLMIVLVLLMFIIPISVKRLRRRLKHVEMRHESLSQITSNVSSVIGSSLNSSGSSSSTVHHPSLSQFTMGSSGSGSCLQRGSSSVFRQSSLDSALSLPVQQQHQHFNRVDNGSIANPMYLHQQQQQTLAYPYPYPYSAQSQVANLHHDLQQLSHGDSLMQHQMFGLQAQPDVQKKNENIYYPISDEFYSTIQADTIPPGDVPMATGNLINQPKQIQGFTSDASSCLMTQCAQPIADLLHETRPPDSTASSPTLRSLTRLLSLPAYDRRQSQANEVASKSPLNSAANYSIKQLELQLGPGAFSTTVRHQNQQQQQQFSARTIARTCNVDREQVSGGTAWELERHRLLWQPSSLLGEGEFGQVWRCKLSGSSSAGRVRIPDRIVAVKSLKKNAANRERGRDELLAEIEIMKLVCNHPNVVKLLHCCTLDRDKPIYLVMEYIEQGKLQSYLEKSRKNHLFSTSPFSAPDEQDSIMTSTGFHDHPPCNSGALPSDYLTSRDLMKFIYHVAKGMEYISSKCIVHRDIASRNILVSGQKICKIGDFGMARHMQSQADVYERRSGNCKVPVRWMAPEVLLSNNFTTKSDVFSFGILMWEIITLGSTPYTHLKTEQVIDRVARKGERPERPDYCHEQLYEIMSRCWKHDPATRPSFRELVEILGELVSSANNYIELDQYPDHDYYNIPTCAAPDELL